MSWRLMDRVCNLLLPCDEERVLLRLARHAYDDGTNCRPGMELLMQETGRGPRAIQRSLVELERRGYIRSVAYRCGGRGKATEWQLCLAQWVDQYVPNGDIDDTLSNEETEENPVVYDAKPRRPRQETPSFLSQNPVVYTTPVGHETVNRTGHETVSTSGAFAPDPLKENGTAKRKGREDGPEVVEVFAYYRERIQSGARICPTEKIRARLKTFTAAELKTGIDHFAADAWWMDNNGTRGAPWFFHSDARSEQFLNLTPRKQQEQPRGNARPTTGARTALSVAHDDYADFMRRNNAALAAADAERMGTPGATSRVAVDGVHPSGPDPSGGATGSGTGGGMGSREADAGASGALAGVAGAGAGTRRAAGDTPAGVLVPWHGRTRPVRDHVEPGERNGVGVYELLQLPRSYREQIERADGPERTRLLAAAGLSG